MNHNTEESFFGALMSQMRDILSGLTQVSFNLMDFLLAQCVM